MLPTIKTWNQSKRNYDQSNKQKIVFPETESIETSFYYEKYSTKHFQYLKSKGSKNCSSKQLKIYRISF